MGPYYQTTQEVQRGEELLVHYGQEYAHELGIDMYKFEQYRGKEDHTREGAVCPGCETCFFDEDALAIHQDRACYSVCSKQTDKVKMYNSF